MLIFNRESALLLSTPTLGRLVPNLDVPSLADAQIKHQGYIEEIWPDGVTYLTGFYHSQGFEDYPGLGWTVLVRQKTKQAYAPVYDLQQKTFWALLSLPVTAISWMKTTRS